MKFFLYSLENISAIVFGLFGAALVARVFGPENMGRLSVVQSVSTIFIFLATLGLDHFVVRDFSIKPDDQLLKGSLIVSQTFGWLLYVAAVLSYFYLNGNLYEEATLILSVVISTFFLRVVYIKLYLQSVNDAKSIALAAVISRVFALAYLSIGSYLNFSYDLMILFLPIQGALQTMFMWAGYKRWTKCHEGRIGFSWLRIKALLSESWPIVLATALYYAYSQADILIVSYFMDNHEVGIYSAAMRLIPQAAFIGHIAAITFYSQLVKIHKMSPENFDLVVIKVVKIQALLGLSIAVVGYGLSNLIIYCLYGDKFVESASILSIGTWAWIFMIPAALFSRLLVLTKISKIELLKALIVAPFSLGLNFFLIPKLGSKAAAYVTVASYAVGDFLIYGLFKESRYLFFSWLHAYKQICLNPYKSFIESYRLITHKDHLHNLG